MASRLVPTGVTLLELIVVIALMGGMAAVVGLAFPVDRSPPVSDPLVEIARARTKSLELGSPVLVSVTINGRRVDAWVMADGSVIADSILKIDRLSGR